MKDEILKQKLGVWLAVAQHQDKMNSWPWVYRWLHKLLISWRCPACIEWNKR